MVQISFVLFCWGVFWGAGGSGWRWVWVFGVFCASVLTATFGDFATLINKQLADRNMP